MALEDLRVGLADLVSVETSGKLGKAAIFRSNLPVLSPADAERIAVSDPAEVIGAIIIEILPVWLQTARANGWGPRLDGLRELDLIASSARYAAAKMLSGAFADSESELAEVVAPAREEALQIRQQLQRERSELQKHKRSFIDFRKDAENELSALEAEIRESAEASVRAYLDAQRELHIIEEPAWVLEKSSIAYRRRYNIGLLVLIAGVVVSG